MSKLVAAHVVGRRNAETTTDFLDQLRERVPHCINLFTDGYPEYLPAIDGVYGAAAPAYAQVIKPDLLASAGMRGFLARRRPQDVVVGWRRRSRQRARVLTAVKARRCAPPPLRGADGLDSGSAHARTDWPRPTAQHT